MHYTDRTCTVSPYNEDEYKPISGVPIVQAATGYTSKSGRNYILILNEALSMPSLDHSLWNPNQMRHYGVEVDDNPYSHEPMHIASQDGGMVACLQNEGTTIYMDTWAPSTSDLDLYPHIVLTSPHAWNPQIVQFPKISQSEQEEVEMRSLKAISNVPDYSDIANGFDDMGFSEPEGMDEFPYEHDIIMNVGTISHRIIESITTSKANISRISTRSMTKESAKRKRVTWDPAVIPLAPLSERLMESPKTFISKHRHSSMTPEDLSERWCISVAQAALTLKATTRKLVRSALMPLARRYRVDRMFMVNRIRGNMATDTMDARCNGIHGERYCQVFGNKDFFVEAYPITKKSDCHEPLKKFIKQYGVPDCMIYDGSKEQNGKNTEFQSVLSKYNINTRTSLKQRSNQNPSEGVIRELRKKWFRTMFKTGCPRRLWNYGFPYIAKVMQHTASHSGELDGRTPIEKLTGETPDISEYLDFGFYDWVIFKDDAGLGEVQIGKFLGVSHDVGSLMSYWILPISGIPVSRTSVQRLTLLEKNTEEIRLRMHNFTDAIAVRFKEEFNVEKDTKPTVDKWSEFQDDQDFIDEFQRVFSAEDIPEADDEFEPDSYDNYINMEIALDKSGEDHPQLARVTKRLKDNEGNPIGRSNKSPFLDTRQYEVEFNDGQKQALTANLIAQNMFSQVNDEGHRHVLLDSIIDMRTDGSQILKRDAFVTLKSGAKRRVETTKGWESLMLWKDGSTTWTSLKDVKESYPVQLAEYAIENNLTDEPAFAWWVNYVHKKRERILSKVKSKYWVRTHKYGIRVPKTVQEAIEIDRMNQNHLWWESIMLEMKNVRPAFEKFEGDVDNLVGYQEIKCHMIFDIKLGENFRRKSRLVGGGHTTSTPASLTYSSVVSRDSVRICLTIAALNGLDLLACDIQNAYLTAKCREKIYIQAGKEFGSECGCIFIVKMALYGLKSSGAAFRSKLAGVLHDMNYRPSMADPDVWMRPATKPDGFKYYEYILCYVDDVLILSHNPQHSIDGITAVFKLKNDKAEVPDMYLGAQIEKVTSNEGTTCWTMSSVKYLKAAIDNVEEKLAKDGLKLPTGNTPMTSGYHPAEDVSAELNSNELQYYQELIGVLRWAIEIGRVDILLEVALLSSHLALPREGHLQQVYHIFGYLNKSPRRRLFFDPDHPQISETRFKKFDWEDFYKDSKEELPPNMPEARGNYVSTHCFVDANHAADKSTRKSQTGILIFINKAPVLWHSKRQNGVEASTFGSEFIALKNAFELVVALRYKLRMFGIPIEGETNMFCDNEAVYKNSSTPESVLNKKHHSIAYHYCRSLVAMCVGRLAKEDTKTNLADLFTKCLPASKRNELLDYFMY